MCFFWMFLRSNWKSLRFRNLQEKLEKRNSHLKQSSCPLDVEKNVGECADSIGIATHHHIGKSYIIIHRDLTSWNSRVEALLIQFDIFKNLDGLMEITEQGVQPQKSDQRKVAQHFIQWMSAKLSSNKVGIFASGVHLQLFVNVRFVNHGVENIQNLQKHYMILFTFTV